MPDISPPHIEREAPDEGPFNRDAYWIISALVFLDAAKTFAPPSREQMTALHFRMMFPRMFLVGRAIELGFKALVCHEVIRTTEEVDIDKVIEKRTRAISHDLEAAECAAAQTEAGKRVRKSETARVAWERVKHDCIGWIGDLYKSKTFEYYKKPKRMQLPDSVAFEELVERLLQAIHKTLDIDRRSEEFDRRVNIVEKQGQPPTLKESDLARIKPRRSLRDDGATV